MGGERNQDLNPELDAFIDKLRGNREEILEKVEEFLRKPNKTGDELALGIYLDAVLKEHVFGIDPFASKRAGDEEVQDDRITIAFAATEYVAANWLMHYPDSGVAQEVVRFSIFASSEAHHTLIYEMWPSIFPKLQGE